MIMSCHVRHSRPSPPARIQPPRGSTHRTQAGNVVMVSTDLGHMYQLKETYGQAKNYTGHITVEEVFTKDVIKCSMNWRDVSNMVLKFFPNDSATMMMEIRAYEALMPLQGCVVPRFISVFFVDGHRGQAIGLSAVEGITLRQHFKEEAPIEHRVFPLGVGSVTSRPQLWSSTHGHPRREHHH